jgi:hypothetical protein
MRMSRWTSTRTTTLKRRTYAVLQLSLSLSQVRYTRPCELIAVVAVVPLVSQYYFRTHRVVLGNRRFGAGGFVGNGRQQARAVVPKISVRHGGGGGSSSSNSASASSSTSKERTTLPPPQSKKAAERAAKAEAKASKEKARKDAAMSSKKSAAAGGKARAQAPVSSAQAPVSSAHRHTNTTTPDAM